MDVWTVKHTVHCRCSAVQMLRHVPDLLQSLRGPQFCRCPDEADAQALRAAVLLDEMKRPVGRKVQVRSSQLIAAYQAWCSSTHIHTPREQW